MTTVGLDDPSDYTTLTDGLDLPAGSQLVATEPLDQLVFGSPIAIANRRVIVLDGPSGTGKTTALQVSGQLNRERRVVIVTLDDNISPRGVLASILAAIIGEALPRPGPPQVPGDSHDGAAGPVRTRGHRADGR